MIHPRKHPLRLAVPLLLGAALALSCGPDGDSVVLVHVGKAGDVPDVFQLRATLSNSGSSDTALFPDAVGAAAIKIPTDFSVTLPRALSGHLDIALDGLGPQGSAVVANGAAEITISRSRKTEVSIQLGAGAALCGNGRVDTGEDCDDGDRISNGSCDFLCHRIAAGAGGGSGAGTGGSSGVGGVTGTGTGGGTGAGGRGAGGTTGTGGVTGTGGRGTGGAGVGGAGVGGSGVGGAGSCSVQMLVNGAFEAGPTGWTVTSSVNPRLILDETEPDANGVMPGSHPNLAVLGRNLPPGGEEILSQSFLVPAAASTLTFLGQYKVEVGLNNTCSSCNPGFVELVRNGAVIPVFTWNTGNATVEKTLMTFSTTVDAVPLRNSTILYRLHATSTQGPPTRYYFDGLSVQADRCQ